MKIFGIRYFIIRTANTLFELPDSLRPHQLFVHAIHQRPTIRYYGKEYTTRIIEQTVDNRFLIGYLLKSVDLNLISLDEVLFNEQEIENWEKILFVIDQETQIIAFEQNSAIASPENIKNVLTLLTNSAITEFSYNIQLEFIVDKLRFWSIIDKSTGIFQIAFKLNAPNLFGASKVANEWLKELKERHNMTSIGVDVKNENAALKYDKEELESYRDYADSGGGQWTLTVLQSNRKKRYKSENHLRKADLEIDNDSPRFILRNIQEVINRMSDIIKGFND
jgi:hypothetical protein